MRYKARESFLNVYYIQELVNQLLMHGALDRITDKVARAYHIWRRFDYLLNGKSLFSASGSEQALLGGLLPSDNQYLLLNKNCSVKPWTECFGRWLRESSSLSQGETSRPTLAMDDQQINEHWKHLYDIHKMLKDHFHFISSSSNNVNGTVSSNSNQFSSSNSRSSSSVNS